MLFLPFLLPILFTQSILFKNLFPKNKNTLIRGIYLIACIYFMFYFFSPVKKVLYGYITVPKTSYLLSSNEKKALSIKENKALFFNDAFIDSRYEAQKISILHSASYFNIQGPIILDSLSEYKNNPFSEALFAELIHASAVLPKKQANIFFNRLLDFCISTNKKSFYPIIIRSIPAFKITDFNKKLLLVYNTIKTNRNMRNLLLDYINYSRVENDTD